jgi:hypothetical protein
LPEFIGKHEFLDLTKHTHADIEKKDGKILLEFGVFIDVYEFDGMIAIFIVINRYAIYITIRRYGI